MPDKSAIYRKILREYEKLRDISREKQERRSARAYELCPGLEKIDKKTGELGLSLTRAVLESPETAAVLAQSLAKESRALEREKKNLLAAAGLPEDYLEPVYECQKCRDTGYAGENRCSCFSQKLVSAMYWQAGLSDSGESFGTFNIGYYSDEKDPKEGADFSA